VQIWDNIGTGKTTLLQFEGLSVTFSHTTRWMHDIMGGASLRECMCWTWRSCMHTADIRMWVSIAQPWATECHANVHTCTTQGFESQTWPYACWTLFQHPLQVVWKWHGQIKALSPSVLTCTSPHCCSQKRLVQWLQHRNYKSSNDDKHPWQIDMRLATPITLATE